MKIAVCLSGQPRFIRESLSSLQKNVLSHNDCDLYIHAWCPLRPERFSSAQPGQDGRVGSYDPDTLILLQRLRATLSVAMPRDFSKYVEGFCIRHDARQDQLASYQYAIRAAGELMRASNKAYDAVIRARLDLIYRKPFVMPLTKDQLNEAVWVPSHWQECRTDYTCNDCLMVSSPKNMEPVFGVYDRMRELNTMIDPFPLGENYVGMALHTRGVKVKSFPVDCEIAHRVVGGQYTR